MRKFTGKIVCGGMGANISDWNLAQILAKLGVLATVSGVALGRVLALKLQAGDPGGHYRRALAHFPFPKHAEKVLKAFFVKGGIPKGASPRGIPAFSVNPGDLLISLEVCANFAAVWLAKEGHGNPISINYLEKIAMPLIYSLVGAMLAGADYVTMGAGMPFQMPEVINAILEGRLVTYRVPVDGKNIKSHTMAFDPRKFFGGKLPQMERPGFLPIIASTLLASLCMKQPEMMPVGSVDGFCVEGPTAGGHNAPPRGKPTLDQVGRVLPVYGPKDVVDIRKIVDLGLPCWFGGGRASPEMLQEVCSLGGSGIQVGTAFAFCKNSGMDPVERSEVVRLALRGEIKVFTGMRESPSGYPFKVVQLPGSMSDEEAYRARKPVCNQGALVSLYERSDGTIGYRCPAEPLADYLRKGGDIKNTLGKKCFCNGLLVTAGLLSRPGELAIVTAGDDLCRIVQKLGRDGSYTAKEVVDYLLG